MFKSTESIYEEGFRAHKRGENKRVNPYSVWRPSYWSWLSGWLASECSATEARLQKITISLESMKAQETILRQTIKDLSASSSLLQHEVRSYKSMLNPPAPAKHTEPIKRKEAVKPSSAPRSPAAARDSSYGSNNTSPYADPYWALNHIPDNDRREEPVRYCDPDPVPSRSWSDSCSSSSYSDSGSSSCSSSSSSDSGSSCGGGGD